MSPRAYAICHGDALTPEKQAAYRKNWAKAASSQCQVRQPKPPPKPKPSPAIPAEILAAAEAIAPARGLLAGDLIAQLTTAIGIPPCDGCKKRKEWLNKAHLFIMGKVQ